MCGASGPAALLLSDDLAAALTSGAVDAPRDPGAQAGGPARVTSGARPPGGAAGDTGQDPTGRGCPPPRALRVWLVQPELVQLLRQPLLHLEPTSAPFLGATVQKDHR